MKSNSDSDPILKNQSGHCALTDWTTRVTSRLLVQKSFAIIRSDAYNNIMRSKVGRRPTTYWSSNISSTAMGFHCGQLMTLTRAALRVIVKTWRKEEMKRCVNCLSHVCFSGFSCRRLLLSFAWFEEEKYTSCELDVRWLQKFSDSFWWSSSCANASYYWHFGEINEDGD